MSRCFFQITRSSHLLSLRFGSFRFNIFRIFLLFQFSSAFCDQIKALLAGGTAKKIRNRVKYDLAFLPGALQKPLWKERPEILAKDWCEGLAIRPPHNFADAPGVTKRFKTRPVLDAHGERVPQTDEHGELKIGQNGQPLSKFWKQPYFIWTHAPNFSFGTGEGDVLAYAETLKNPGSDKFAMLPDEVKSLQRVLRHLLEAVPDPAALKRVLHRAFEARPPLEPLAKDAPARIAAILEAKANSRR